MIDWANQNTLNFFPKDERDKFKPFTTHPTPPRDRCTRNTVGRKLMEGSNRSPFTSGCSMMGLFDNEGLYKAKHDGKFLPEDRGWPWELQFVPNANAIPEYIDGTDPLMYIASIKKIDGEPLFYTYARIEPGADLQKIGEVWLDEDMFTSKFGDTKLFF